MDFTASHLSQIALAILTLSLLYNLFKWFLLARSRRAFAASKNALPAPLYPQYDHIFGLDQFRASLTAFREHRMLAYSQQRFKTTGTTTFSHFVLGRKTIMTIEPANLKVIQALEHKKWGLGGRRVRAFRPLLGDGIFTNDGLAWSHSREMLRPNFVRSQIGDVLTFERHVSVLISKLQSSPNNQKPINLADYFFRLTLDSATEFLFGESTNSLSQQSEESFGAAFDRGQSNIAMRARFGPLVKWLPFLFDVGSMQKDQEFVHAFVDYYVDKGCAERDQQKQQQPVATTKPNDDDEKSSTERYIFIDELVRQTTDRTRIRSELLNILLAGRDTTASLLTNLWWLLSKNPSAWSKLQSEVASLLGGSHPTFENLKELKFLRALLNETLRLYPVVPQNSREAQEDTILPIGGGADGKAPLFVAKGQVVGWSVYAMHRRPEFYGPDAEEFRPERWLDDPVSGTKGLRPGWEYLPFNGGARICLGQQFALTEAGYTTVRLCQAFAGIESADETQEWREKFTLTCVNLEGAKVVLTPR